MRTVGVEHLVGRGVGVVYGHGDRTERNAVEAVRQEEDTVLHVLQREVRTQHLLVEVVFLLADLLGVIPPVPRFEHGTLLVGTQQRLHLGQLLLRAAERRGPYALQQVERRTGRAGHLVGDDVCGIGVVAQQVGFLGAQTHEVVHQLLVIVLVVVVRTRQIALVELAAQVAARRVGHERQQARLVEREDVLVLQTALHGLLVRSVTHRLGQPFEVLLREFEREARILGQHVVAELHAGDRQVGIDLLQALLLLRVEQRARTHEAAGGLLQQTHLLGIESQGFAAVVERPHPLEESVVHQDPVVMGGQAGHDLLLHGLELLVGVGGTDHAEHQLHLREHAARVVEGQQGILERRLVVIRGDGLDLRLVERHRTLECGHVVLGADLVERRHTVGRVPLDEKRVLIRSTCGIAGCKTHKCTTSEQ